MSAINMPLRLDLPGVRRFVRSVQTDLDDGSSVFLIGPDRELAVISPESWRTLLRSHDLHLLDVKDVVADACPVADRLYDLLGLSREPGDVVGPGTLAFHDELGRRTLIIDARRADPSCLERWAGFVAEYASVAKEVCVRTRTVFLTLLPARGHTALPPRDVCLTHRWWWGVIGRLDTMTYVQERIEKANTDTQSDVVIEVASFDLDLADRMIDEWDGRLASLKTLVADVATGLSASEVPCVMRSCGPERPPNDLVRAWSCGHVERWDELTWHVGLEAVEDPACVDRRVWMAQVRSLFPRIEVERRRLATWVASQQHRLDRAWQDEDVTSLEIGPLWKLVRDSPRLGVPESRRRLFRWLVDARNALAHGDPIDGRRVREGLQLLAQDS